MFNYISPIEFFIILFVGILGWVFACAFGINAVFNITERFLKWFHLRRYYNGGSECTCVREDIK